MSKRRLDDDAMRLCKLSHFRQKDVGKTKQLLQVVFRWYFGGFQVVFRWYWQNETTSSKTVWWYSGGFRWFRSVLSERHMVDAVGEDSGKWEWAREPY